MTFRFSDRVVVVVVVVKAEEGGGVKIEIANELLALKFSTSSAFCSVTFRAQVVLTSKLFGTTNGLILLVTKGLLDKEDANCYFSRQGAIIMFLSGGEEANFIGTTTSLAMT